MLLFNSCNVIGVLGVIGKRRELAGFCPEELIVLGVYIVNIYAETKQYVIISVTDLYFSSFSVYAEPSGALLKCSSWFGRSGVGSESPHF